MPIIATLESSHRVGLRDLRANLSGYVEEVKAGRSYVLTEHGKPVAQLVPLDGQSTYDTLVAEGVIRPARGQPTTLDAPIAIDHIVSDLVGDQRR